TEAEVHCDLAFIYLTKSRFEDARRECQTACQLDRFCNQAHEMLAHLDGKPAPSDEPAPDRPGKALASPAPASKPTPLRREARSPRAPRASGGGARQPPGAAGPQPV